MPAIPDYILKVFCNNRLIMERMFETEGAMRIWVGMDSDKLDFIGDRHAYNTGSVFHYYRLDYAY